MAALRDAIAHIPNYYFNCDDYALTKTTAMTVATAFMMTTTTATWTTADYEDDASGGGG